MSTGNGKSRLERISEQFKALMVPDAARVRVIQPPTPVAPTPEEVLHLILHEWAERAPAAFTQRLEQAAETAHKFAAVARKEHAEMNYWTGYEQAIRDLRVAFTKWTEPTAGNPLEGPLGGQ
jgi:hypothetical protein